MANAKHSSESVIYGTPLEVVSAARETMGGIDLDPCSSKAFNRRHIKASKIFTRKDDGMRKKWCGRVFCNPPGGKVDRDGVPLVPAPGKQGVGFGYSAASYWFHKMLQQHERGNLSAGIFVCFSMETLQVVQGNGISLSSFSLCVPSIRLKFEEEKTGRPISSPTHANSIVGIGVDADRFAECFEPLGACGIFF